MRKLLLAALLLILAAPAARAQITVKDYLQGHPNRAYLIGFVQGMEEGMGYASAWNETHRQNPLYCQPMNLGLTAGQVEDILNRYIKAKGVTTDSYLVGVLLDALRDAFPCNQ